MKIDKFKCRKEQQSLYDRADHNTFNLCLTSMFSVYALYPYKLVVSQMEFMVKASAAQVELAECREGNNKNMNNEAVPFGAMMKTKNCFIENFEGFLKSYLCRISSGSVERLKYPLIIHIVLASTRGPISERVKSRRGISFQLCLFLDESIGESWKNMR